MANLILPRRFTQQPQYPVEIDRSNPITKGLQHAVVPCGTTYRDVVTGVVLDASGGTPTQFISANRSGYSRVQSALTTLGDASANSSFVFPSASTEIDQASATSRLTFLALASIEKTANAVTSICGFLDPLVTGSGFTLNFDDNFASGPGRLRVTGSLTVNSTTILPNPIRQKLHFVGAAYKAGSDIDFYANGLVHTVSSSSTIGAAAVNRRLFIGNPGGGSTFDSKSLAVSFGLFFNRVVTPEEYAALYDRPWQIFKKRPQVLYFDVGGGGATTYTNTSSLDAAIQQAISATASLGAAIQQNRTASASVGAAIQAAFSATASLDSAIQRAAGATTSLDAYIAAAGAQTANASLDAAIQQARAATASLGAAVQAALAASASIDAAVLFSGSASAGLDAYVQVAGSSAAIASLDAAIQSAGSATTALGAAIQTARSATASLGAAVQVSGSASASVDAYILAGSLATASLDAAIMATVGASASLNAYIYVASDHAALSAPRTGAYRNTSTATRSNLQTARRPRS